MIAIIDRMEGGTAAFAAKGYELQSLLTIRDFGIEPPSPEPAGLVALLTCHVWKRRFTGI